MWRVGRSQSILTKEMILTLLPTGATGGGASHTITIKEIMWKPQPTGLTGRDRLSIQWGSGSHSPQDPQGGRGAKHPVGQSIANHNHGRGVGGGTCGPDTYMSNHFMDGCKWRFGIWEWLPDLDFFKHHFCWFLEK